MKKSLRITLLLLGLIIGVPLLLALVGVIGMYAWQPESFGEAVLDTEPPVLPDSITKNAILVFSKTSGGFRHGAAIDAANRMIAQLAEKNGWSVYYTENGAVFDRPLLKRFVVVVWNNATGAALSADQRLRFRQWLEADGGYVGLHAAGDGSHENWEWYTNKVIKVPYNMHTLLPEHTPLATLTVEDRDHPATADLPDTWSTREEWYAWRANPRDFGSDILVTVDESTYEPWKATMGNDHPVVWSHSVGLGRAFYSAFGHEVEAYSDPLLTGMIEKAIIWAGRLDRRRP